jgi:hypothetical protein
MAGNAEVFHGEEYCGALGIGIFNSAGFQTDGFLTLLGEKDGKCSRGKLLWGGVIRARGGGEM